MHTCFGTRLCVRMNVSVCAGARISFSTVLCVRLCMSVSVCSGTCLYCTHLVINHPKGRYEDSVQVYNTISEETAGRNVILLQETNTYHSRGASSPIESATPPK